MFLLIQKNNDFHYRIKENDDNLVAEHYITPCLSDFLNKPGVASLRREGVQKPLYL